MVDRILAGDGALQISRPGIDVKFAQKGQFLLDARDGGTIYQCVAEGNTLLDFSGSGAAGSASIGIDASFAGYSNLFVWNYSYYARKDNGAFIGTIDENDGFLTQVFVQQAGAALNFSWTPAGFATGTALWCRWVLFRNSLNG